MPIVPAGARAEPQKPRGALFSVGSLSARLIPDSVCGGAEAGVSVSIAPSGRYRRCRAWLGPAPWQPCLSVHRRARAAAAAFGASRRAGASRGLLRTPPPPTWGLGVGRGCGTAAEYRNHSNPQRSVVALRRSAGACMNVVDRSL